MPDHYEIIDPRPIAAENPYTFLLPSAACLEAIGPGDLVKAIFHAIPPSQKWNAERMWVIISHTEGGWLVGKLDSKPEDLPNVPLGTPIRLPRSHVISIDFGTERATPPPRDDTREYFDRCLVDQCVLDGERSVSFVYRETPEMGEEGDKFPDSGWRIRDDWRGLSDEEVDARKLAYVALGAVLNEDDSWVHLIDSDIGTAFLKNFGTGQFEPDGGLE